jgi:hypothetical protein
MPQDLTNEGITFLTSIAVFIVIIVALEIFGMLKKK